LAACPPFSRLLVAPLPRHVTRPSRRSPSPNGTRDSLCVVARCDRRRHPPRYAPVSPRERPTDSASSPQLTDYASSLPRPYNPPPPSRPAAPRTRAPAAFPTSAAGVRVGICYQRCDPQSRASYMPIPIDPYDLPGIPSCLGASCSNRAEWNTTKHAYEIADAPRPVTVCLLGSVYRLFMHTIVESNLSIPPFPLSVKLQTSNLANGTLCVLDCLGLRLASRCDASFLATDSQEYGYRHPIKIKMLVQAQAAGFVPRFPAGTGRSRAVNSEGGPPSTLSLVRIATYVGVLLLQPLN
ncbi:hypothetical protein FB451DRAFT_1486789, partial [Mycena latifolia]